MRVPNVFVELAKFLSTPSARRATVMGQGSTTLAGYFYPRPPRGGRPSLREHRLPPWVFLSTPSARRATPERTARETEQTISIHALREEGNPEPPRI